MTPTTNARQELVDFLDKIEIEGRPRIKCAALAHNPLQRSKWTPETTLKYPHTAKEYFDFFSQLDFNYDNGLGIQELFGVIWFMDGTWAERDGHDLNWVHRKCPDILAELIGDRVPEAK